MEKGKNPNQNNKETTYRKITKPHRNQKKIIPTMNESNINKNHRNEKQGSTNKKNK
jgi:hypothetical protein